jgi:exodeoxyribonuclease-3
MEQWLRLRCQPEHPILWCGDINVAPGPLDVYDPKRLQGQVGFHPDEWAALARTMSWGLSDLFRKFHPEEKQFTFWDYRLPKSFARDLGWRIDHMLASQALAANCLNCWVDSEPRGWEKPSDHTPILASFNL